MVCYSKLDQSSFTLPPDLKEIHMDTCRIGKVKDIPFCYFIEAKGGMRSKGCSGVYAGWTHEHDTDEQRRQRTIWGYIMVPSSRHNAVDSDRKKRQKLDLSVWDTFHLTVNGTCQRLIIKMGNTDNILVRFEDPSLVWLWWDDTEQCTVHWSSHMEFIRFDCNLITRLQNLFISCRKVWTPFDHGLLHETKRSGYTLAMSMSIPPSPPCTDQMDFHNIL